MDQQIRKSDPFPVPRREQIEITLQKIQSLIYIQWEWDNTVGLIISGLDGGDPIEFGHWRSAKAFVDAYLLGYDAGYERGQTDELHKQ